GNAISFGEIRADGNLAIYPVIGAIPGDGDEPIGFIVEWRELGISRETVDRFSGLIGEGALLYIANSRGNVWTDLRRVVEPIPIVLPPANTVVGYENPAGYRALAAAMPIDLTPWTLLVEF